METIEINENYRYTADLDMNQFDYLSDWEWESWGMFTIRHADRLRRLDLDTFGINGRIANALDWTDRNDWNHVIAKVISRAGYAYEFLDLQGYSQGDWHDVVVYWDPKLITETKGLWGELEGWYCGDVYNVALEQKTIYTSPDGRTIEDWDVIESIGRVIFYGDYQFTKETCDDLLGYALKRAA